MGKKGAVIDPSLHPSIYANAEHYATAEQYTTAEHYATAEQYTTAEHYATAENYPLKTQDQSLSPVRRFATVPF
jgi:predicted NAD-dependent protein-ADP-ribosyltransferase YbiA (DUF1768 family)